MFEKVTDPPAKPPAGEPGGDKEKISPTPARRRVAPFSPLTRTSVGLPSPAQRAEKGKPSEFDISRKVIVLLDGKPAALDALKPGQKVTVVYNPDLEVITPHRALSGTAGAAGAVEVCEVVATGVGLTPEKALTHAFTVAVEQSVGVLVDASTIVANDQIIEEKIRTASNAYIEKYDVLKRRQADGLHHCQIKAQVRLRKLQQTIVANNITTRTIRGQDLVAEFLTTQKANTDTAAVLNELLSAFPNKVLTATVTGKPKPLATKDAALTRLRYRSSWPWTTRPTPRQVREIVTRLDKLAITKFTEQIRLLPQEPAASANPISNNFPWMATCLALPGQAVEDSAAYPPPNLLVPGHWFALYTSGSAFNRRAGDAIRDSDQRQWTLLTAAGEGLDRGIDRVWELQRKKQETLAALVVVTPPTRSGMMEVVTFALPAQVLSGFDRHHEAKVTLTLDLLDDRGGKVESVRAVARPAGRERYFFGLVQAVYQCNKNIPLAVGLWPGLRMQDTDRGERSAVQGGRIDYVALTKTLFGHLYVDVPVDVVSKVNKLSLKVAWEAHPAR